MNYVKELKKVMDAGVVEIYKSIPIYRLGDRFIVHIGKAYTTTSLIDARMKIESHYKSLEKSIVR